jgi:uncharacterized membrane protein
MNPYLILGVVFAVGVAGAGGLYKGHKLGKAEVQQAWDKEKAEQYAAYAKAQEEARKKEQELQANADQLRREKDEEIRNLNARATALNNSLQRRPSISTQGSTVSGSTSSGQGGCTPRQLYRESAEDFVKIAIEADHLRLALKQCYAQDEALRK